MSDTPTGLGMSSMASSDASLMGLPVSISCCAAISIALLDFLSICILHWSGRGSEQLLSVVRQRQPLPQSVARRRLWAMPAG